jgi:hypothetical protein
MPSTTAFQDTLRDDSRTELPIVLQTPTGAVPLSRHEQGRLRLDLLFSYQPTPGTVFAGGRPAARRRRPATAAELPPHAGRLLRQALHSSVCVW